MNRKQFLNTCVGGACACAVTSVIPSSALAADQPKPAEDWRIPFIKRRYGKLLELLEGQMDESKLNDLLQHLGAYCAMSSSHLNAHKGDIDGFIKDFKAMANEDISYDRNSQIVTIVGPERSECFCPLVDTKATTKTVCNCSLGWQKHTYETLLGKKVHVELTESVVRGGKRCTFKVHVSNENVEAQSAGA